MHSTKETLYARAWVGRAAFAAMVLAMALVPVAAGAAEKAGTEPAETAEAKPTEKGASPELTGEHAVMAREVNLTEKQKKQIAETVAAANEALAEWREANQAKVDAANAALTKARQAGDREALRQALADAQPLFRERQRIQQTYQQKVMEVLTDKQRVQWVGFVLWRTLTGQAEALDLTPDQSDQARALSDAAAKKLLNLGEGEEASQADAQAARTIQQKLVNDFVEDVLTDPQREALQGPAAGGPPAQKPEPGTTPEKGENAQKTPKPKG